MAKGTTNVSHGSAGGSAINVDVSAFESFSTVKKVQLSANYIRVAPGGGVPVPPDMTGAPAASRVEARTILSGVQLTLHLGEANALIAAGKATAV